MTATDKACRLLNCRISYEETISLADQNLTNAKANPADQFVIAPRVRSAPLNTRSIMKLTSQKPARAHCMKPMHSIAGLNCPKKAN